MTKFERELHMLNTTTRLRVLKHYYVGVLRVVRKQVRANNIGYIPATWDTPELRRALLYKGLEFSKMCTIVSHTKDIEPKNIMGFAMIRPDFN